MPKIIVIGFGNIAKQHIKSFKFLGYDIECIVKNKRGRSEKDIELYTWENFPGFNRPIKAIICALPPKDSFQLLKDIIPDNIPTLYEKPLFKGVESLNWFLLNTSSKKKNNTFIAFNRRHYKTINSLKKIIIRSNSYFLESSFSDRYLAIQKSNNLTPWDVPMYITSHWIDMIGSLVGYQKLSTLKCDNSSPFHISFSNENDNDKKFIQVSITPNQSRNHYIRLMNENKEEYLISPLEELRALELEVIEPKETETFSNRKYNINSQLVAKDDGEKGIKPGFLEQANWFISEIDRRSNTNLQEDYFYEIKCVFNIVGIIQEWNKNIKQ